MANKSLDIVIKVRDAASGKIDNISKSFEKFGTLLSKTKADMFEFNRAMSDSAHILTNFYKKFAIIPETTRYFKQFGNYAKNFKLDSAQYDDALSKTTKALAALNRQTQQITKASDNINKLGKNLKNSKFDVVEFNKSLFYATTFMRFFQKEFHGINKMLSEGVQIDRVTEQFRSAFDLDEQFKDSLGQGGNIAQAVKKFTGASVDRVEAMRAAISIKTLGIQTNLDDTARLISMAGAAARSAGFEASEGVKRFTDFLKNGEVSNLEFLNLIRSQNPAFRTQMAMLGKYGGVLGPALTSQQKFSMGMRLLTAATDGMNMKAQDLSDVIHNLNESFKFAKAEVSSLIAQALAPLSNKLANILDMFSQELLLLRKNNDGFVALTKSILVGTTALTGFIATFGLFKLATRGITYLGLSVSGLGKLLLAGAGLFTLLTSNAKKADSQITGLSESTQKFLQEIKLGYLSDSVSNLIKRLSLLGLTFKGIFQLVSSYFESENMTKGIAKMNKSLYDLLSRNKLIGFVQITAQSTALISKFLLDVGKQISIWSQQTTKFFEDTYNSVAKFLGFEQLNKGWFKELFDESNIVRQGIVKVTAALLGLWSVSKVFRTAKGIFGSVPIIGKMFQNKEQDQFKKPSMAKTALSKVPVIGKFFLDKKGEKAQGTLTNPFYVIDVSSASPDVLKDKSIIGKILSVFSAVKYLLTKPTFALAADLAALSPVINTVIKGFIITAAVVSTFYGAFQSFVKNFDVWKNFGKNLYELISAKIRLGAEELRQFFKNLPNKLLEFFSNLKSFGSNIWENISSKISSNTSKFFNWVDEFSKTTPVISTLRAGLESLSNTISPFIAKIKNFVGEKIGSAVNTVKDSTIVKEWITPYVQTVAELTKDNFKAMGKFISSPAKTYSDFGGTMMDIATVFAEQSSKDMFSERIKTDILSLARTAAPNITDFPGATGMGFLGNISEEQKNKRIITKGMLPGTSEERKDYLQEAIMQLKMVDRAKGDQMSQRFAAAIKDGQIDPEEFASVLNAKLEEGLIGKSMTTTAKQTTEANKKTKVQFRSRSC